MYELPQQLDFYSHSSLYARGKCRELDPSLAESTLGCWDLYMRPEDGKFGLTRDFLVTPHLLLYTDDYDNAVRVLGATRADTFSLSFTLNCVPGSSFYGQNLDEMSALAGFDSCVDVQFGAGQQVLILMLDRKRLNAWLMDGYQQASDKRLNDDHFALAPRASAVARKAYLQILNRSRNGDILPAGLEYEVFEITCRLIGATLGEEGGGRRPPLALRRRGYERALQHLEALPDVENIRMGQLSTVAGVSQRTLEYAFRDYLGCTPGEYLKRRRFQKIRRNLLTAPQGSSVQDIAARQGVFEFGRMAGEYRRMFGELPSESLSRRFSREEFAFSA